MITHRPLASGAESPPLWQHSQTSYTQPTKLTEENILLENVGAASSRVSTPSFLDSHYAPGAQLPPRQDKPPRAGTLSTIKRWTPELIWCFLDLALFVAMIAVLANANNKPMPEWPAGLTLNTLIAIFGTLCRAMTIVPLAEAISQLKWNWFASHQRPLSDMYLFDQASRGPWGAFLLVIKARGRFVSFAWVAAIVLVSGLATSFLTQSAITYQNRPDLVPAGSLPDKATAPKSLSFPGTLVAPGGNDDNVPYDMSRAAFRAAFYTVNESWPMPAPHCPTSNCTWSPFDSLAVCATMSNVTDHLNVTAINPQTGKARNVTLPNELGFLMWKEDGPQIQLTMTSPTLPSDQNQQNLPFADRRQTLGTWDNPDVLTAAISQFFLVFSNSNPDPDGGRKFRAIEILWHFCVNTYSAGSVNGTSTGQVLSSTVKIEAIHHPGSKFGEKFSSFNMKSNDRSETFNVTDSFALTQMDANLRSTFTQQWKFTLGNITKPPGVGEQLGRNMFSGIFEDTSDEDLDKKTWDNLNKLVVTVGDGITSYMRTEDKNGTANGDSFTTKTYVHVRWEWLAFLAAQIGLTILFLVAVIVQTARLKMDIVKSSNTAELFALHGGERKDSSVPMGEEPSKGLRFRGINTEVNKVSAGKLINDGGGWKLKIVS